MDGRAINSLELKTAMEELDLRTFFNVFYAPSLPLICNLVGGGTF